ncbi:MAG: hypothetical protein QXQ79_00660 [Candidatus Nanoarchaeia archaeon]
MAEKTFDKLGHYLFLLGVLLAIVFGLIWPGVGYLAALLAVIGIVVGLLNITAAETKEFLIAVVALIVAANSFALVPLLGTLILEILKYLIALFAPAAVIVALIAIWKLAKTK